MELHKKPLETWCRLPPRLPPVTQENPTAHEAYLPARVHLVVSQPPGNLAPT